MNLQFDFPVIKKTYKVIGGRALKLYIFEPEIPKKNRPAILFFNGGSFKKKPLVTPLLFQHQANYFSSKGMVAICVDYRNGSDEGFTPIQAICDVKSAVRWLRENSTDLGVDPNKVVICGSSAGGYIAVSSIMFENLNDDADNLSIDNIPNVLVVFGAGMDGVDIMGRRYPEMLERAVEISPIHNIKKCLPPTLWMCGTADDLYDQNKQFVEQMVGKENDIKFITYDGMGHGFFRFGEHENKGYHESNLMIENYLKSLAFIED